MNNKTSKQVSKSQAVPGRDWVVYGPKGAHLSYWKTRAAAKAERNRLCDEAKSLSFGFDLYVKY